MFNKTAAARTLFSRPWLLLFRLGVPPTKRVVTASLVLALIGKMFILYKIVKYYT
ncbi:hypothetical protein ACTHO0_27810 [Cytobacillus praedii]|uniref:hypothetical protein n=1 Tax=Cytobacillus praedii TaxID=1742358 RepID=UPI003F8135FF